MLLPFQHWLMLTIGVAVTILTAGLLRRRISQEKLAANNEFVAFASSIVGLVYGIILAFTVIVVWEQFERAEEHATIEAAHISALWRDAELFAPADRERVRRQLRLYVESVINDEFQTMAAEKGPHPRTGALYRDIWRIYFSVQPGQNNAQVAFHQQSVVELNELDRARRIRLLDSANELPPPMWLLLVIGTIITIGLIYLHSSRHAGVQIAVTASVALLLLYSVMMVAILEHPFSGPVHVTPAAYKSLLWSFQFPMTPR
jgi:hypothetical protein